jgi:hypothetical protein
MKCNYQVADCECASGVATRGATLMDQHFQKRLVANAFAICNLASFGEIGRR